MQDPFEASDYYSDLPSHPEFSHKAATGSSGMRHRENEEIEMMRPPIELREARRRSMSASHSTSKRRNKLTTICFGNNTATVAVGNSAGSVSVYRVLIPTIIDSTITQDQQKAELEEALLELTQVSTTVYTKSE
jgi:hypothetical protein